MRFALIIAAISVLASTNATLATPHHPRKAAPGWAQESAGGSFALPRMNEVAPGRWRSTYDPCYCDY